MATRKDEATRASGSTKGAAVTACPHSWDLEHWPEGVYPHGTSRARYLVRMHKNDLIAAGALARVGREFVILGAAFTRWLQRQTTRAAVYDIAPNRVNRLQDEGA